jgi:hypothetical protein
VVQGHEALKLGAALCLSLAVACGNAKQDAGATKGAAGEAGGDDSGAGNDGVSGAGGAAALPFESGAFYAEGVESFTPGGGAGFNQDKLPDIVLGPPKGEGTTTGSLDVVSLGAGGEIVLSFGDHGIVDGPGPDLVVFENPFWPGGDASKVWAELGEVSLSEDGKTWLTFPCDKKGDGKGHFPGCAGVTPTLVYDATKVVPLDPAQSGGDAFDLADIGLEQARFVKIHDLETLPPGGMTTGFDLDAVCVIHAD